MTEKIYYRDVHQTEFTAVVLSCEKEEKTGKYAVVLDRTAFFPEEGGQSADHGTLDGQEVLDVKIHDDIISHILEKPAEVGKTVAGKVDWNRRFDFMQQHSGEHMLSGTVHRHFGFDNVGFHLGADETTLDFNGALSLSTLRELEAEVNSCIFKNLPVQISFPQPEVLKTMDYRSKLELTHDVRIVEIPGVDVCACCAPHVDTTGQIGILKITNVQNYKGGVRLSIVCGARALKDYTEKQDSVSGISVLLSARPSEIGEAVERLKNKEKEDSHQLSLLQAQLLDARLKELPSPAESENAFFFAGELDPNTMRNAVNGMMKAYRGYCAVFSGSDDAGYRFFLGSAEKNCAELASALRKQGFKGGGSTGFIQGSVGKTEAEIREIMKN